MSERTDNTKRGRPATGSLYYCKSGWRARTTIEIDGERVQKSVNLGTHERAVARIKLKRWLAQETPDVSEAAKVETFEEAARRIVGESGIKSSKTKLDRMARHIFPRIGSIPVDQLTRGDCKQLLHEVATGGLGKQMVTHIRNDIRSTLAELVDSEMLPSNVADRLKVPRQARPDLRERAVLTDEELSRYLAWKSPDPARHSQRGVRERQTMAVLSRVLGGLRSQGAEGTQVGEL